MRRQTTSLGPCGGIGPSGVGWVSGASESTHDAHPPSRSTPDTNRELDAANLIVQAGLGSARDHALTSLLSLNGLRISEALGADIDAMDLDRGHRTLAIVRKGGKHVIIPLAPRTGRTLDLYIGERTTGPIFLGANGSGWTATPQTAR